MAPPNTQYGILGNRLGFRLNYQGALQKTRTTWATFQLDGQPVKVRYQSVTIHDVINDTPNTCALTIDARTPPNVGQRLTVRINSNAPRLLFAGPIQTVGLTYEGKPTQPVYPCQAIDDTPLANRKLPYGQFVNTSATTVGQWLVTNFCPAGFSSASVQAGLPPVSVNFDATEGMDGCLRQVAKLIGGYFYWEDKVLHLFQDGEPGDTPDPIDATHPFLNDPPISVSTDTSQVRTRTYGKGYAETLIADVAATDTILPISNAVMFNPYGGQAVTETQRLAYTGTVAAGGGTVVGPGVTPVTAPTAALALGAGFVTAGLHDYAISFVTAAGESLVGPRATINVTGLLPAPPTGPRGVIGTTGGNGPDAGTSYYSVSFVTPTGETLSGPGTAYTQPTIAAGTTPISALADQWDGNGYTFQNLHVGDTVVLSYTYATAGTIAPPLPAAGLASFGPASAGYVMKQAGTPQQPKPPGTMQNFSWQVPYSPDPNVKAIYLWMSINFQPMFFLAQASNSTPGGAIPNQPAQYWAYQNFVQYTVMYQSTPQPAAFNPIVGGVNLSQIPLGPAGVTARKLYRYAASGIGLRFLATLGDNTTDKYKDTTPDSALGAAAPTTATATVSQVQLSGIPISQSATNWRRVYRTAAGATQLKLLATISDNVATTYLDTLADGSLGVNAPSSDTSGLQQPPGSVLAGDATMIVAGAGWAQPAGGWAIIGNGQQTIRYTGISGNSLTGIPHSGPGAITASVSYNSTITGAAMLLGVTGLLRALITGAPINLWVQRDDLAAQAAVALDGTDGVIEHLITDERRGETSLTQLCDADLAQYSTPIQTVPYATRDVKTKSGKPITFALASPAIYATLTIQDVTITEINLAAGTNPRFTVTASSVRFSLEDMLRRLGASLDVTS